MPSRQLYHITNESKLKCKVLNTYIEEFKAKHPNLSSNQIAAKLDIPQASLNRIENCTTNPSLENILNIMVGTGNQDKIIDVLTRCYPSQKEKFNQIFSVNFDTPFLDNLSARYAIRDDTFLLMQMAFTRNGTTEEEVKEKFGTYGLQKLHLLLDEGVLVKREDNKIVVDIEKVKMSFSDSKRMMLLALEKLYDPYRDDNHLSYQTEAINDIGFDAIFTELKKAQGRIREIMYDPQYYGNIKVFVGMIADRIIRDVKDDIEKYR